MDFAWADLSWMAWTWPTAAFFVFVAVAIASMGVWEYFQPGGAPRRGVFLIDTTRGDRLFVSLVGSAFIFLGWLGLVGTPLWWPTGIAFVWALFVFRFV
jgi:predicted small integral membrane protein